MHKELRHDNPYHDPDNGRFTYSPFFKPGEKGKNSPAQNVAKAGEDSIKALQNFEKQTRKKKRYDFSNMTDEELRKTINRMNMEKQYTDLKNEEISRGRRNAAQTLEILGSVASIGSSAALIGTAIYKTRHP